MRDPQVCRPIAIAVLMRFLQQLTGVTPLLVYLQPIFENMNVLLVSTGQASVSPRTQKCPEKGVWGFVISPQKRLPPWLSTQR